MLAHGELVIHRPDAPRGARRPCGRGFTKADNKIPRRDEHELNKEDQASMREKMKTIWPDRLRHLVRSATTTTATTTATTSSVWSAAAEAGFQCDTRQLSSGDETDTCEEFFLEVDSLDDGTDMVRQALQASGFTGKEKRFRELPL